MILLCKNDDFPWLWGYIHRRLCPLAKFFCSSNNNPLFHGIFWWNWMEHGHEMPRWIPPGSFLLPSDSSRWAMWSLGEMVMLEMVMVYWKKCLKHHPRCCFFFMSIHSEIIPHAFWLVSHWLVVKKNRPRCYFFLGGWGSPMFFHSGNKDRFQWG